MPESTITSAAEIRAAIDFESEYVVHVCDGGIWNRPEQAEHRTLHGLDVWHAVRRSRRYAASVRLLDHDILTFASSTAALRFIPAATYKEHFCSSEDCENSTAGNEGRDGLCSNCAARAHAAKCAGRDKSGEEDDGGCEPAPPPPPGPAQPSAPVVPPYAPGDVRRAAAAVHRTLLSAPDGPSGVGTVLRDQPVSRAAGADASRTWCSLGEEQATAAYRAVYRLVADAPDLAEWAILLAADRLVPEAEPLTRWQDDEASVRIHLAFADRVPPDQRAAIRDALRLVLRTAS